MPPAVEIDVDARGAFRGDNQQQREPPPHPPMSAATAARLYTKTAPSSSTGSSGSLNKGAFGSMASMSADNDEYDEDVYSLTNDDFGPNGAPRGMSSSFSVDRMLANSRDSLMVNQNGMSTGSMRDSLMVNGNNASSGSLRQSEYGSAVMRMDEGYRSSSVRSRRTAASGTVDGLTPLLQAARSGDIVLLNSLIIQPGTDILRRDPVYGQTALHFAIRGGHLPVVQALLMPELAGSIVNVPDARRNTALHLAAAKSRRMAKILVDAGADVNFLNMRNQTPLGVHLLTVTKDDPTMTELLLQARANADASVDQSTALHVALDKGLHQIAQRLVRHGARLDLKDESGKTVFDKVDAATLKSLLAKIAFAPVWIPDDARSSCMECDKKFGSVGARRHHCRLCGRVLCSKCASHQVKTSQLPFRPRRKKDRKSPNAKQRVCTPCYEVTMEADGNNNAPHE